MIAPRSFVAFVVLAASLCVQLVFAQPVITVDDLMDKGGKVLSKDEAVQLVSGAKISGTQMGTNTLFENTYNADGTIKGRAHRAGDPWREMSGQWSVTSAGRFVQRLQSSTGSFTAYSVFIQVENAYYMAENDARTTVANLREISR
ncbi:MAG: hypothetical protein H7Z77_02630 [Chitinophagaceae bacterium]|nr:hypothetical protein [Polaromonas sp.]